MRIFARFYLATAAVVLLSGVAQAAVKVEFSGMHICCGACVKGIEKVASGVEGVKVTVDKDGASCTAEAADVKAIQKFADALAAAGFHADSNNKEVAMKDDSKAPQGKVQRLVVNGAHNCCGACARAIKDVATGVEGVKAAVVEGKATSFVVEGDFSAEALVKALNDNGFHVTCGK